MAYVRQKNIWMIRKWITESKTKTGKFTNEEEIEVIKKAMDTMGLTKNRALEYINYVLDRHPDLEA